MLIEEFTFYDLGDYVYEKIEKLINKICELSKISEKGVIFFEIVGEIVQNAAKANFKEVLKLETQSDSSLCCKYRDLMKDFKERLPEAHFDLAKRAKDYNLYITLQANLSNSHILHLCVINNRPASNEEMDRLDFKIEESRKYTKLANYYLDHYDETEGAGLGTALIDISLRAMGYSNYLYRVYNDFQCRTIAELIVDLKENSKK